MLAIVRLYGRAGQSSATDRLKLTSRRGAMLASRRSAARSAAMPVELRLFVCLRDNYGVLLHDPASGATAAIDAPEAAPVEAALAEAGWRLNDILVTHHHGDHTAGIEPLKQHYACRVVAPAREASRIPQVDIPVR